MLKLRIDFTFLITCSMIAFIMLKSFEFAAINNQVF